MASKNLHIVSGLDGQHLVTLPVSDDTTIRDIQGHYHQAGRGLITLLGGVERLQPERTVREIGLQDGEELFLLWSKIYYETAGLRGNEILGKSDSIDQCKDNAGGIFVQIPKMVDCIEHGAFEENEDLLKVLMHSGVTRIGDRAFLGCKHLTLVVNADSITRIGWRAFKGCSSLTQVVIPNVSPASNAKLSLVAAAWQMWWPSSKNLPFSIAAIWWEWYYRILSPASDGQHFAIAANWCEWYYRILSPASDGEHSVAAAAWQKWWFPKSLSRVGDEAFAGCISLTRIVFSDSIASIGHKAFHGCKSLAEVVIPNSIALGVAAFQGTPWVARSKRIFACWCQWKLLDENELSGKEGSRALDLGTCAAYLRVWGIRPQQSRCSVALPPAFGNFWIDLLQGRHWTQSRMSVKETFFQNQSLGSLIFMERFWKAICSWQEAQALSQNNFPFFKKQHLLSRCSGGWL